MTMKEYSDAKPSRRFLYRLYRHPVFLFLIVPPVLFFIINRFPGRRDTARENSHTWMSNLILGAIVVAIGFLLGWDVLWQVHLMIFAISSVIGVWLFYVQHQFDPGYWMHEDDWNAYDAALQGSSHYRLPKVLQWFSGNIGFHHIHHLRPRIPNYNLESCYRAVKELQLPKPLTLWTSLRCMTLNIWEEASERLITFRQARRLLPRLTARTRLAT